MIWSFDTNLKTRLPMSNEYDVKISHLNSVSFIRIYKLLQPLYVKREQRIHNKLWDIRDRWDVPCGYENYNDNDTIEDIDDEIERTK